MSGLKSAVSILFWRWQGAALLAPDRGDAEASSYSTESKKHSTALKSAKSSLTKLACRLRKIIVIGEFCLCLGKVIDGFKKSSTVKKRKGD